MSDPQGKKVDEDWKRRAQEEKERLSVGQGGPAGAPKIEVPPGVVRKQPPEPPAEPGPPAKRGAAKPAGSRPPADPEEARRTYPEATFETLVGGLAQQALVGLGQMEHPATGQRELDLESARYTIDSLVMLRHKTKGNLGAEESARLEEIISELQMIFVQISNRLGQRK